MVNHALCHPFSRIALVAATFADGRDTMVEGESGILGILPKSLVRDWNRSLGELVLMNGSRFKIFSAEQPERLRGPQHHRAWADELAAWQYLQDTWDMMMFGLRLGRDPKVIITTTPKPLKFIRNMLKRSKNPLGGIVVTSGSTFENAKNLARAALQELREVYQGTRMGRQELYAEVLDEIEGALWTQQLLDRQRVKEWQVVDLPPLLGRVGVGVDPSVTSGEDADRCGIVVAGLSKGPCPVCPGSTEPHAFVLEDNTQPRCHPTEWARAVSSAYRRHSADFVVAEVNNGGELVETVLQAAYPNLPVRSVHASRGKVIRAEPVAALYEKGKVHHYAEADLTELEDEMTTWTQEQTDDSPDRMDALVWVLTKLMLPSGGITQIATASRNRRHRGRR